ncbi:MAG: hypothetical protein AB7V55_00230 [Oscillospiraceae bacterium]|jgi:hypothetical protein
MLCTTFPFLPGMRVKSILKYFSKQRKENKSTADVLGEGLFPFFAKTTQRAGSSHLMPPDGAA